MDGAQISDMEGLVLSAQLILSLCGVGSVPAFEPDLHDAQMSTGGARVEKQQGFCQRDSVKAGIRLYMAVLGCWSHT